MPRARRPVTDLPVPGTAPCCLIADGRKETITVSLNHGDALILLINPGDVFPGCKLTALKRPAVSTSP
ncbi:hypothetical protein KCP69_25570 [Salmonella enterica subsp. enterica]|nr:hypothetical protein KCP69_25570 [Salmonella enterica subsp. enterica]